MSDKSVDGTPGHATSGGVAANVSSHPSSSGGANKNTVEGRQAGAESKSSGASAGSNQAAKTSTANASDDSSATASSSASGQGAISGVQASNQTTDASSTGVPPVPSVPGIPGASDKAYNQYSNNHNGYKKNFKYQGQGAQGQGNQGTQNQGNQTNPSTNPSNANSGSSGNASGSGNGRFRRPYKVNQPNYNYGYQPSGMYSYGYMSAPYGGYQVMPNMQIPPYGVPIQPYSPIPGSKVKLTTKDGKPVDLEEKKKKTAASTPSSSPAPSVATPVQGSTTDELPTTPTASVTSPKPAVATPSVNSAAEEFKRKIREKAAATKAEKEKAEKEKAEKEKAEKERIENEKAEKERAEKEMIEKERAEKERAEKEEIERIEREKLEQEKLREEQTKAVEDTQRKEQETSESKGVESADLVTETSGEVKHTEEGDAQDAEEATNEEEAEPTFKISNFLERVSQAKPIDDIFSVKYPEDIVSVDSSKKIPGKKYRYDPQFLIQFRQLLQFPMDPEFKAQLEKVDIQTTKKGPNSGQRSMSKFGNGLPGRFNGQPGRGPPFNDPRQNSRSGSKRRGGGSGSSRDKSTRKSNQSKRGGREPRDDETNKQITIPPEEIKPLEKTENRWVPRSRAKKTEVRYAEDGSILLEEEDVERKVKSFLNKLTLEMFAQITDDVIAIANQSKWEKDSKTIRSVISLTFAKACDEPYWSEMYAKFCAKLCTNVPNEVTDETITLPDGSHPSGGSLARRILLTTCQTEYEKGWTDKLPTKEDGSPLEPEMMSDEYYVMAAAKRRGLGLVKFIGHLYNLGMLNDQVIFVCLRDQCKNVVDPSEDSLENLAQLVKTVGPKLDTDERKKAILKIVFENIQKILDNVKLSSRIMFMLMDLQDLRKQRWISDKSEAGPKTIEEIHRDAEIKRMEELKASNEKKQQRRFEGRSNSSRSASSAGGAGGSGYLSNLKKSPSFATQNNQFSNASSSKNDSDLNRESSKRSESAQVNRFAALGADDESNE